MVCMYIYICLLYINVYVFLYIDRFIMICFKLICIFYTYSKEIHSDLKKKQTKYSTAFLKRFNNGFSFEFCFSYISNKFSYIHTYI